MSRKKNGKILLYFFFRLAFTDGSPYQKKYNFLLHLERDHIETTMFLIASFSYRDSAKVQGERPDEGNEVGKQMYFVRKKWRKAVLLRKAQTMSWNDLKQSKC